MSQPAAKLSVSVPGELAAAVRKRVGTRGPSGFVARATAHELEGEGIGVLLAHRLTAMRSTANGSIALWNG